MHRLSVVGCVLTLVALPACPGPSHKPSVTPEQRRVRTSAQPRPRTPPARARGVARPAPGMVIVNGLRVEVLLIPERTTFLVGEPIFISFKVHNHTAEYIQIYDGGDTRNRLFRPSTYRLRVRKVGGSYLPVRDAGPTKPGLAWPRSMMPDDGFSRELFLPDWVHISRPGRYEIVCSRVLHVDVKDTKKKRPKKGEKGVLVTARARVTVKAATPAAMGTIIQELAGIMLSKNWASINKATRALAAIQDPRIVSFFIKGFKRNRYNISLAAARVFGRFATPEALAGLKLCKDHRTKLVRQVCAKSMAASKLPKAWPLLLSMREDGDQAVRITVLHALGKKGCGPKILEHIRKLIANDVTAVKTIGKKYLSRCPGKRPARHRRRR